LILKEEDYNRNITIQQNRATNLEFYPHIHRLFFPQMRGVAGPDTAARRAGCRSGRRTVTLSAVAPGVT